VIFQSSELIIKRKKNPFIFKEAKLIVEKRQ
jgi:hypothetical protein